MFRRILKNLDWRRKMCEKCSWCNGDGYFGDFCPGFYPLPCSNCTGTGYDGLIEKSASEEMQKIREKAYSAIREITERPDVAANLFGVTIRLSLNKDPREIWKLRAER